MVLCINFITWFIWCCFWPPSTQTAFPFFDSFCVVQLLISKVINLMVGLEVIVVWWKFQMLQNDFFLIDLISFFRISVWLRNGSFLMFSVCLVPGTSVGVFLLVVGLWRAFVIELSMEILGLFSPRFFFAEFMPKMCAAFSF